MPVGGSEGSVIGKAIPEEVDKLAPLLGAETVDAELLQRNAHERSPLVSGNFCPRIPRGRHTRKSIQGYFDPRGSIQTAWTPRDSPRQRTTIFSTDFPRIGMSTAWPSFCIQTSWDFHS